MKNKVIYFYELILMLFILLLKFVFINKLPVYQNVVNSIFWIGSLFVLSRVIGLKKDNNVTKSNVTQIVIIGILGYVLVTYLSGMFLGFLRNSYSLNLNDIISNIYSIVIMIFCEEYIRSMVARKSNRTNKPLVYLTIEFILLDFLLVFNMDSLTSGLKVFVFITNTILPNVCRHILCSYIVNKVSVIPSLITRLFFGIYQYIFPIYPDLGPYLTSLIGAVYPYIIYMAISKTVQRADKDEVRTISKSLWYINIPIITVMCIAIALISGVFKYQMMAIGSGSMEPVYYRGDAVVFEKIDRDHLDEITEGVILVFIHDNNYVTHRVVEIKEENKKKSFQTKGDNNPDNDNFIVHEEDVRGIVKFSVKYVGLPTIWFQNVIG